MDALKEFKNKNLLLLQSQFIFFWRLSKDLKPLAKSVHKINFNGGDWIFYPKNARNYTGKPEGIANFLVDYVKQNNIDTVIMFNDCKPIHRIAKTALSGMVNFYVFEQGYIRPDYITLEKDGVNGYSQLPKEPDFYRNLSLGNMVQPKPVGGVEFYRFLYAVIYFIFFMLLKPIFKSSDYSAPKLFYYALSLLKGIILSKYYCATHKRKVFSFIEQQKGKYYFVPLQIAVDSQIRFHSPYKNVYQFIEEVLISFSKNAPDDTYLVFKHHPFDLGLNDYRDFIYKKSLTLGVHDRVKYFKIGDIELLIKNSIGCVMVNSTCGMTTLKHKKPLKIMGRAIYDIEGLVYKKTLDDFWIDAFTFKPDEQLIEKFTAYVIYTTQINGSFYKRISDKNTCGVNFPSELIFSMHTER